MTYDDNVLEFERAKVPRHAGELDSKEHLVEGFGCCVWQSQPCFLRKECTSWKRNDADKTTTVKTNKPHPLAFLFFPDPSSALLDLRLSFLQVSSQSNGKYKRVKKKEMK